MMNKIIIKTPQQIEGIRKSCKLAAQTLKFIKPHVVAGITTNRLDELMEKYILDHHATSACKGYGFHDDQPAFPKSTCISINEVICHGIPDERTLKDGDIVSIDVTTILEGYYGDTAITFPVGEISEDAKHLVEVTKKCLDLGVRQVRPGNYFGNIGYEIGRYANLQNYSVVENYCGHGVGIEFHEPPSILHIAPKNSGAIMHAGMIFTIEPILNTIGPDCKIDETDKWTVRTADGGLSAQFEYTILVTSSGYEILTLP